MFQPRSVPFWLGVMVSMVLLAAQGAAAQPAELQGGQAICSGVTEHTFFSASRGLDVDFSVWEPPAQVAGETYPALYFLHGAGGANNSLFGILNNLAGANGDCGPYLSQLMLDGTLPKMFLIGVDDEDGGWSVTNETMVVHELPTHIEANWPVTNSRQGRHIQGFSMGAAGATRYPAEHPDRYCSTVIMAELHTQELEGSWIDNQADILAYDVWARLVVGDADTQRIGPMTDLYELIVGLGVQAQLEIVPGAAHSAADIVAKYPNPLVDLEFHASCSGGEPFPGNGDGTFDDDDGSIFEEDIEWLAAQGITNGCAFRLFCPLDFVTRGQMAAFLHRALPDLPEVRPAIDFVDDDGSIFEADIEWLYSRGITNGTTATTYGPGQGVTREQMAAFLHRALPDLPEVRPAIDFVDDDGSIFEADIEWLYSRGITNGTTATTYGPTGLVTRGQMAAFLHRALTS